jgi:hypothetical protein
MPTPKKPVYKHWMCTWCGCRVGNFTRPNPGHCSRKPRTRDGKMKPHTWVRV